MKNTQVYVIICSVYIKKNSYLQQQNQSPTHDDAHNPILNFSLSFFFLSFFFFTNNCKFVYKTNKSVTFQNVLSHPHNISLYILNHDKSARQSLRNKASVFDGKYCRLVISNSSLLFLICSCSFIIPYIETCNRSPTPSSLS